MLQPSEMCALVTQAFWLVLGAGLSSLLLFWRQWRTTRFLKEALVRQQRSGFVQQQQTIKRSYARWNELQKSLLERFLRAPVPSLSDLAEPTAPEFRLRPSARSSTPPPAPKTPASIDETTELETKDFTRL
jgi:hypothetical protein